MSKIIDRYIKDHPAAESPYQFMEIYSISQLEQIIKKAGGKIVEFKIIGTDNGEIITDLIVPYIGDNPVEGFGVSMKRKKIID